MERLPLLYTSLAEWWPVLSAPSDYAEAASFYWETLRHAVEGPLTDVLELGSGGGNNASHLKKQCRMTLVDLAPGMLAVSRRQNPECTHRQGDMRSVRLDRTFDAVFVQDAVSYLTTEADVAAMIATAWVHSREGGAVLLAPDYVTETFRETTSHGGHTEGERALRYLEWTYDPDPSDTRCRSDMVYLMREAGRELRVVHDRHELGLFPRRTWIDLLAAAGFVTEVVPFRHSELPDGEGPVFVGRRPSDHVG